MKSKLILLFFFIFQISLAQTQCPESDFIFNKYIDVFMYVNNDNSFKPNKALIHIAGFYSKDKGYTIVIPKIIKPLQIKCKGFSNLFLIL